MREILFRGKDRSGVLNHQWIYGALDNTDEENPNIIYLDRFGNKCIVGVLPETVGQYTGLTDKNGKKIFEGDIIKYPYHDDNDLIVFYNGAFGCTYAKKEVVKASVFCSFDDCEYGIATDLSEVIGNIHDNPELLKGE